jgi:hypothetical protein
VSLLLYINGQLADLEPGQVIAQTRQVNDLNSLETRQAGYTNKFKLPKTAGNVKIMQFLTLPGNSSNIPYQKNACSLYSHTGECFVYNGWAVITDGGDSYDCVVYDGIIDLYKEIENKTLADVNLTALTHEKTVQAVKDTWEFSNTLPYRYLLADYNGDMTTTGNDVLDIDYQVPSVRVSYLWQQIMAQYGIEWSGSIFDTQNFKNLWLTFPKSANPAETGEEVFVCNNYYFPPEDYNRTAFWFDIVTAEVNAIPLTARQLKIVVPGYYKIDVTTTLQVTNDVIFYLAKNKNTLTPADSITNAQQLMVINNQQPFSTSANMYLNAGDTLSFYIKKRINMFRFNSGSDLEIKVTKMATALDFASAFKTFSITDFLKEITHRFGLTIFKDRFSRHYRFLTLQEILQTDAVDWSKKFSAKISENYLYGSYARRNWLRYAYNDKEGTYKDSYLDVDNINLPDSKEVIKSKIYSPEFKNSVVFGRSTNVYKFWDKEIGEDSETNEKTIEYKPLDSRYYLMRAELGFHLMTLKSTALDQNVVTSIHWRESFYKLSFEDVIDEYYAPMQRLLYQARVVTADVWLTDADVARLDFSRLHYIEQLSSYFIINKINYIPGKVARCELVRVHYALPDEVIPALHIYRLVTAGNTVTLHYTIANFTPTYINVQYSANGVTWQGWAGGPVSPRTITAPSAGQPLHFRLQSGDVFSNTIIADIPSNTIIDV